MRVVKWLTGLLYQLSLFITRSWEVHFHPRQGKVTAGRLQERGGARARGGGRTEAGERLCPLGDRSPAGALGTPVSVSSKHPRRLRLCGVSRNRARRDHVSLRGPRGGGARGRMARAPAGTSWRPQGGEEGRGKEVAAEDPECQSPCLGRVERMNPEQGRASIEASGDWKEGSLGVCEKGKRESMATWPWFYAPSSKRED